VQVSAVIRVLHTDNSGFEWSQHWILFPESTGTLACDPTSVAGTRKSISTPNRTLGIAADLAVTTAAWFTTSAAAAFRSSPQGIRTHFSSALSFFGPRRQNRAVCTRAVRRQSLGQFLNNFHYWMPITSAAAVSDSAFPWPWAEVGLTT